MSTRTLWLIFIVGFLIVDVLVIVYFFFGFDPLNFKPLIIKNQPLGTTIKVSKAVLPGPGMVLISTESFGEGEFTGYNWCSLPLTGGTYHELSILFDRPDNVRVNPGLFQAYLIKDSGTEDACNIQSAEKYLDKKGNPLKTYFSLR